MMMVMMAKNITTMKAIFKYLAISAVAVVSFVACQQDIQGPVEVEKTNGENSFKFYASTGDVSTKATLTPNEEETAFAAAWEDADEMVIESLSLNPEFDEFGTAVWDSSEEVFNATYDESVTLPTASGDWTYSAWYPGKANVPFQSNRVQNGNAYNSGYDLMYGSIEVNGAQIGKNANGTSLVIPMNRLTAIAYYHITSDLDEDVVSATLTVDEGKTIAAETIEISGDGKTIIPTNGSNTITITFEDGKAPKATDFQLWFNILTENIGSASSYNVTVDIVTTGHTAKLTSKSARTFTAGKLNRAKISSLSWNAIPQEYVIEFINKTNGSPTSISNTTQASTVIENSSLSYVVTHPFTNPTFAYYGGDQTTGLPLRLGKSSDAGEVTIALSDLGSVSASEIIVNAQQYTAGKTKKIGVNNSEKQQPGDSYSELSFPQNGSELNAITLQTDGYIYVKSIKVIYTPRKSVSLSFPESSYSIIQGDSFIAPVLTIDPSGLEVSYTSSEESVATVNASTGAITLTGGVGTTVITASYAGNNEYNSAKASYNLIVNRAFATSISQIKEDLNGSTTEMDFTVQLTNAIVTRKYSNHIAYIQDETAGIYVTDAENLSEGDSYSGIVTGKMVTAHNQPSITELNLTQATKTTGATRTPEVVTIATLTSNTPNYDGMLCKVVNAKADNTLATGTNKSISISQGESTMTFFSRPSFDENTVVADHYYDIVGIPCKYDNKFELVVIHTDDVTPVTINWVLNSISVSSIPDKTSYTAGEFFDPTGLEVTAHYESQGNSSITKDEIVDIANLSFEPSSSTELTTSHTVVTITYNGKSTSQPITVVPQGMESVVYTLNPTNGSNNGYANNCDIEISGITWNLTGNSQTNPWRIGGKSLTGVERTLFSKTKLSKNISKIEITHGAASSITVNSMTVIVSKNADFSSPVSTLTPTFVANETVTVDRPADKDWSDCYYKFVYNVTVSSTSNKFIEFTKAEFIGK